MAYQKYTVFVKLYICGLTYRIYVRYKHKLRIDVITYIPSLANGPPSAAVCLLPLLLHRSQYLGYPNIRTGYPLYCTGGTVYLAFWWWIPWDPPWICGMRSLLESAVGSLLRWVARKNFLAKSPPPIPGIRR